MSESTPERRAKFGDELGIRKLGGTRLGDEDEVGRGRQLGTMNAHELAQSSFHSIADYGVAHAATDAEAEPRGLGRRLFHASDDEIRRVSLAATLLDLQELGAPA